MSTPVLPDDRETCRLGRGCRAESIGAFLTVLLAQQNELQGLRLRLFRR